MSDSCRYRPGVSELAQRLPGVVDPQAQVAPSALIMVVFDATCEPPHEGSVERACRGRVPSLAESIPVDAVSKEKVSLDALMVVS